MVCGFLMEEERITGRGQGGEIIVIPREFQTLRISPAARYGDSTRRAPSETVPQTSVNIHSPPRQIIENKLLFQPTAAQSTFLLLV